MRPLMNQIFVFVHICYHLCNVRYSLIVIFSNLNVETVGAALSRAFDGY